ncbi:MAG TPA: hypothetical protein DEO65_18075 [Bacillus bacterium]|uniref:Uncharacterized protein n=1 Tax=Siminovitchia fordii TaxID=254759 RepID=A0ABQ4K9V7_9BACI|nr:hypothetical protein [Siminovitchia fordii]GIN21860.1 hypothetical protein J1TS3_29940 [Siminovitchia fordii]HBZ11745.1 hypothetical protein [Bacillus sp. (in: firmicutes)]
MSVEHYHSLCHRHMGRAVEIRTRDGRFHRGIIRHVSPHRVYLEPIGPRRGGFGYGFGGFGYGWWGFGAGIALGFIAGISLLWWW